MRNLTPLRFPGNKRWLVSYIKDFIIYHKLNNSIAEPYSGSAAISLGLLEMNTVEKVYLNDKDPMIYAFWYSVFNFNDKLIEKIREMSTNVTVQKYYELKIFYKNAINSQLKVDNILDYAATFLFLNRTSYSGIVKGGPLGGKKQESRYKINCRFGINNIEDKIRYLSKFKQKVTLSNLDGIKFIKNFINNNPNTLVYIDPPYFKAGKDLYSFYFNKEDHEHLAYTLLDNQIRNPWLVSYDDDEFIKKLYSKKNIFTDEVQVMNRHAYLPRHYLISSRKRIVYELLFSNKKIPPFSQNTLFDIATHSINN